MESLEISIHSANGLKDQNTIGKMNPYVSVVLSGHPKSRQQTEVHTFGGTDPKWKGKPMKFAVTEEMAKIHNLKLVFTIMAEKSFGDTEVGEVIVLVKKLFEVKQMGKSLSCIVTTPSGISKGMLNFSYKILKSDTSNNNTYEPNVAGAYATSNKNASEPKMSGGYATSNKNISEPPPMAAEPSSYVPGLYPHSPPQPQYGGAAPYPPQMPQYQQQPVYYPPGPPHQHGYPPYQQQWYGQPPPGAYTYPYAYAPPNPVPYAHPISPGYPPASGTKKIGKSKSNTAKIMGALGTMFLGAVIDPSLLVGGSGAMYNAGGYSIDLSDHYSSIPDAIG